MQIVNFVKFAQQYNWNRTFVEDIFVFLKALPKDVWSKVYVAGGLWRRIILDDYGYGKGDVDLFFKDEGTFIFVKKFFTEFHLCKKLSENDTNESFELKLSGDDNKKINFQLIKIQYYENIEQLLDSFDFTLCQFGMSIDDYYKDANNINLYCGDSSLFDISKKRIVINKITYPTASLRRLIKYTKQGFYACNGCLNSFLNSVIELSRQGLNLEDNKYID